VAANAEHEGIKNRAVRGVALVAGRGLAVRVIALGGVLVLARLLAPREFGILTIGNSLLAFGVLLADGGLGAGLIRRTQPPDLAELRALLGLQLALTALVAVVVSSLAGRWGTDGWAVAIMVWSLPLAVLQAAGAIMLERELNYGPRVTVELAETLAYYIFAVSAAASGLGIDGVAAASLARGVVGASVMWKVSPVGPILPSVSLKRVRELVGFGVRFQAIGALNLLRDQGINLGIAAVAGAPSLGLWSLAYRIMQPPYVIMESLWRVSFPAASRLIQAGADLTQPLVTAVRASAVALAITLGPLAAMSPALVPLVFGPQWVGAGTAIPFGCLGMMLAGPASVAAAGAAYAQGALRVPLVAALASGLVWLGVSLPLLPSLGILAIGIGWLCSCLADLVVCWLYLRSLGVAVGRTTWKTVCAAVVVGGLGLALTSGAKPSWSLLLADAAVTPLLIAALVWMTDRRAYRTALSVVSRLRSI
jgi:O-antigen/teichoic acid export membrane protein